jgi:hypothetical protein
MIAIGRGEREPIASNDAAIGRAQNRRAEILLGEPTARLRPAQGRASLTSFQAPLTTRTSTCERWSAPLWLVGLIE